MLFLDDDVSADPRVKHTLDETGVATAMASFADDPGLRAVGWPSRGFDDNSVAGHARRLAGMPQDVFVSAAALVVRVAEDLPFFPDIYNEDWLFLIALAATAPRWRGAAPADCT